ncbi:growth arrest and DNA damage-inducible proteins-interacting protein 1 [Solea senegalensis]|uniref:Growth arrest and DNA damage-inducible proteins-interacting protein 1 n=1 Tax=Solea senegalensis TaxID=28829 RepID=A0AAV6RFW8_SOLSE|nr:growth arrest and DNA damage-inducible proteins-interacting protein 1 [Solea senegalensis]KAG7504323.1 growth arrest and DNA damage-inducible proteins-interacting protein 1 [Solea senegalensis]
MAASVLCRRTAALHRSFKHITASNCAILLQTAKYNPRPLRLNLNEPYVPDKDSAKTPEWQKTARYDAKLYGRYGSASGLDPARLWPSHAQLDDIITEEKEWQPSLEVMLKNIELKEKEETEKRQAKERLIAANMAKMPKMVADWRRGKREAKQKQKEDKARREKLLAVARERFGYAVDPRSPKFLEMVAEIEKEDKKKKKLMKRMLKEEQAAAAVTPPAATS